jgi:DNA (cytosine-5)-methyltransferase 1
MTSAVIEKRAKRGRRHRVATATHRPAARKRKFRHDELVAVDLLSGFGGMTKGIEIAGFTTIMAANHNEYKVNVHEANHPHAEHWIADLVDPDSSDYHSAADLPAADLLVSGVSCTNHSQANTEKAYEQGLTLFDLEDDPDYEARVTRSERDRATAICVLQYAAKHHPRLILIECTTEFTSWGPAIPGRPKIGDGTTYRWWIKQFGLLGYRHKVMYLNSMFFGVAQSRNRYYCAFWDAKIPAPDLEHRPPSWCGHCDRIVEAVWTWRTGIPLTGSVYYGKQYDYRCPSCRREVCPPATPSLGVLDLTNLGTRIGDRKKPLAASTMARAERCRQRFPEFPAILMPAKAAHGVERHLGQPLATQTSQQETALLSTGALTGQVLAAHRHNGDGQHISRPMDTVTATQEKAVLLAGINNFQGSPRSVAESLPTQGGSETLGLLSARVLPNRTNGTSRSLGEPTETMVGNAGSGGLALLSSGILPFRQNTVPTVHGEPMPTVTAEQMPGLLTAAATIKNNGSVGEAQYRAHPVSDPLGTVVASGTHQGLLFSGWHQPDSRDSDALAAEWLAALAELKLEDCYFRMLYEYEVGNGCGFDTSYPGRPGTFIVWGSARDQVDGYGNAVSPQVGAWIGARLRAALHGEG